MRAVIETIVVLASNRLAFRGDWDVEEGKESGLFNALFEVMLSKDAHLFACEILMRANTTYIQIATDSERNN